MKKNRSIIVSCAFLCLMAPIGLYLGFLSTISFAVLLGIGLLGIANQL